MTDAKGNKYFDAFIEMVGYSCEAAALLKEIMENYDPGALTKCMKDMHEIEHGGDIARHIMTKKLVKEFITPIEREDIMDMAESIDKVTDRIEDVLMHMYMFNIREIREDALKMAGVIVQCCEALKVAIDGFSDFRKSKTLHEKIIEINHYEEEADEIFIEAVRQVFLSGRDPVTVIAWYHTLHDMEDCCDACEDVADVIESVMMKNS
ncbi:MAG: DUF47 family protein [Clostridiales Family XIII bacterium]|jgi:predicted phosphate transport protein (TIGR00153 family)|nr:DUF47 family protein [Clostridiales Family XIII bacterium]